MVRIDDAGVVQLDIRGTDGAGDESTDEKGGMITETAIDENENLLWREPYVLAAIQRPGDSIIKDYKRYAVLVCKQITADKIITILRRLDGKERAPGGSTQAEVTSVTVRCIQCEAVMPNGLKPLPRR